MPARVLLVGLDGATFDLIEPWAGAGSLPHLARLMQSGTRARLRSIVPPATFPAWTTLLTGTNPGQHGIYDFTRRVPGTYRLEFVNATYRRRPSVWRLLSQAGRRVAAIGFPASYPPEPVNGLLISGFDSPVTTAIDRSFVFPPGLYDEIAREVGPYELTGFQELRIGSGWHEVALGRLLHAARRRRDIAAALLRREEWDCFAVHFGESDTVAHHFWAFHDPASPRYDPANAGRWGDAIRSVYQELDQAVGELVAEAGERATALIVSDHGSGGTGEWVIHLNRWLERQGWLRFASDRPAAWLAGGLKRLGVAALGGAPAIQEWLLRGPLRGAAARLESGARLGGLDWTGTQAFSEEVNTFPGIWLNVRGREPAGAVLPGAAYERLRTQIMAGLAAWCHPVTGAPVIAHTWRREELYHGAALEDAPDIVLDPALDQGYACTVLASGGRPGEPLRRLAPAERPGAKGGSMNGSHRPEGVLILAGAGVRPGVPVGEPCLVDVAPTLLALLGVPAPAYADGRAWAEALERASDGGALPSGAEPAPHENWAGASPDRASPYSALEAAAVDRKLRGLGYRE
jgi:predicted AlkP superfamily phosphohydrolase/phosphomutase